MTPDETAEFTASIRPEDYVDIGWREIATLAPPWRAAGAACCAATSSRRSTAVSSAISPWPEFMGAGRAVMLASLPRPAPSAAA